MQAILGLYRTSIGKKIAMAVTGIGLVGFVVTHMAGNLKFFQGPAKFDAYAEGLRTFGTPILGRSDFLWIMRAALLGAVAMHILAAIQTWSSSRRARKTGYRRGATLGFSYASKTMRWGGVAILAFVVYHILHLTTGTVHPDFEHGSAYGNVVAGFGQPIVAIGYLVALVPLGMHLYHGIWSSGQTLGVEGAGARSIRRRVAFVVAVVVVVGFAAVPLAVLFGAGDVSAAGHAAAIDPASAPAGGAH